MINCNFVISFYFSFRVPLIYAFFNGGRFWGQVCKQRTSNAFKNDPWTALRTLGRLDRKEVCQAHHQLGLQQAWGSHFHARVCSTSIGMVSTSPTMRTTKPTASTCATNIWAKTTIFQTRRQHPMPRQAPNKIHSRGNWNIFIDCKQASNTYQKNAQENQTVPRLCSNNSRCDHHILSKWHDYHHP